jgi:hypothetical protein
VPFINAYGEVDRLNLLVVTKLGDDMQVAAGKVECGTYVEAYRSALWALRHMLHLGVVMPDPHPYNLAMVGDGSTLALPCDFGNTGSPSEKCTHSLLAKLFNGFILQMGKAYGVSNIESARLKKAYSQCTALIDDQAMDAMSAYFDEVLTSIKQQMPQPAPTTGYAPGAQANTPGSYKTAGD